MELLPRRPRVRQVARTQAFATGLFALLGSVLLIGAGQQPIDSLSRVGEIRMASVQGRIDHLTIDETGRRLFVAALGNDTVEVLDLRSGSVLQSLRGFHEPQGIGQPLAGNLVGVANGGSGDLVLLDRAALRVVKTVALGSDADNVRFDATARRFYVGYGSGAIGAVTEDGTRAGDVQLPDHPESFQLESGGSRLFVNVPGARAVVVVDRHTMQVQGKWPLTGAAANYPMALDEAGHRLFVGCRSPATVLEFDTTTGKQVAAVPTVGDTDDMFYDAKRQRLYVIGGEGFVDVFACNGSALARLARVATAGGARTGLFVAAEDRLYVAAPRRGGGTASILTYDVR